MGALRLNIPSVVCSGGPMMAGVYNGEEVSLSKMFEAVGARKIGLIDDAMLEECENRRVPRLRQLRGHVHRQLHELPVRSRGALRCPATAPFLRFTPAACSLPSMPAWP